MKQMRHRWNAWIGLSACALIACVLFPITGCHRTPAEQAIRETIAAMQKAGDAHDVSAVIAPLADDFVGQDAAESEPLDRKSFQRYLTLVQMREDGAIHAMIGPITVALQGSDRATADFTAVITGGAGLLPDDGQVEQVRTGWRLHGSKWEMISAEWKEGVAGK